MGAYVAAGAAVVGTAVSIYSAVKGGNDQADAQRRQAVVDGQNQLLANEKAIEEGRSAELEVSKIRTHADQVLSQQRVGFAGNGLDVTSGTAASEQGATAETGQYLAGLARLEGARRAYGYRTQGINFGLTAQAHANAAGAYSEAGDLAAAGQGLQSIGQLAGYGAKQGWWG